jgi:hypothetical protein
MAPLIGLINSRRGAASRSTAACRVTFPLDDKSQNLTVSFCPGEEAAKFSV